MHYTSAQLFPAVMIKTREIRFDVIEDGETW